METNGGARVSPDSSVEIGAATTVLPTGFAYLDAWFAVIDKPAGLLSMPTAKERDKTAIERTRRQLDVDRLYPVHRLDRETSGVLLFARDKAAQDFLVARWDEVDKIYWAVTHGSPSRAMGVFEAPLVELPDRRVRVARPDDAQQRPAKTVYKTLGTCSGRTLWELSLATGRKHQLRVHLSHAGFPIVGDPRYGDADPGPMLLQARSLSFPHPDGGRRLVESPPLPQFLAFGQHP